MVRATAMSAASALCLIWVAGCASMNEPAAKAAPTRPTATATTAQAVPAANADVATLAKELPTTLEGEIRRAQLLRSKGEYDDAARSLAQIMLVAPDDARVVGEYGKVLEQQGHSKEALAFLKRALELQPRDWSLQSALGVAYDQCDDHASAKAAYERALALKPGDASVLNNYAVSRMLAGDYAAAQRLFAQAEARGVSNPKIALNLEKLVSLKAEAAPSEDFAPPDAAATAKSGLPAREEARSAPSGPVVSEVPVAQREMQLANTHPNPAATGAPKPVTARQSVAPDKMASRAIAGPRPLEPQVVMEPVPVDPLAGPVAHPKKVATKLASAAHKPQKPAAQNSAKQPAPPTPSLRTAADAD
ncbi:MAG TPA: tetratricopeptide repeat protein [Rhizomicrobium sp.]|jgi:Flp pilus assembly protein TadD|nr:tetratricopeptide repeat protein [Rhizomicrobium sp.]